MIKKLILGFIIALVLLVLTGSIFVYFNKDVIIHGIQHHLKKSGLDLEMAEIDVTFIKSFPSVSASIEHMSLATSSSTPLLTARSVFFNLDLCRLISKEIEIKDIEIRDGHIQLLRDKNGMSNYKINSSNGASNQNTIDFDQIKLINIDFTFRDEKQHHLVRLKNIKSTIKPHFIGASVSAQIELIADGEAMSLSQVSYFFNQEINLNSKIKFANNKLSFQPTILSIGENELHFYGNIAALNSNQLSVNVNLTETQGKLENLQDFLPATWFQTLEPYDITGGYILTGSIKGKMGPAHIPLVELNAQLKQVKLKHNAILHKITNGQGELSFVYGSTKEGKVSLPDFSGQYGDEELGASFELNSFSEPTIKTRLNGKFNLGDINPELIPSIFLQENGHAILHDFDIQSANNEVHYKGHIDASDIVGLISGIGFEITAGQFDIDDHLIEIASAKITALEEKHRIKGSIDLNKETYIIDLHSEHIDLNKFFNVLNTEQSKTTHQVNKTPVSNPKATINLTTEKLSYDQIEFDKTKAKIKWSSPNIHIKSKMEYCQGLVTGSASYNTNTGRSTFRAESDHVDMKSLFEQWNNFEQEQITSTHIKGFGDIQCAGSFVYQTNKKWDSNSMQIVGGIQINKGQLHNVPVLQQFSSFVKIKDLSHIKFNSLSNVFKIEKGRFYLPEMFIQSNAANIILAGHQTLNNELNYALKVNAGQILTNKIKKHDSKLRPTKAKNKGFFNLHYIVKGPIDDFEYFSNKRRVLDKLEQSLFIRDRIIQHLSTHFNVGDRYSSPHLFQDIPENNVDEAGEVEYLPGIEK